MTGSNHPRRRATDGPLSSLAESVLLRILQYAVTVIVLPAIAWSVINVANRLSAFEEAQGKNETTAATYELRIKNLENVSVERTQAVRLLIEKTIVMEQEIRALKTASSK